MPNAMLINLILKEKMRTENGLTIPLQYFVIFTAYSESAIGNMSILLFKNT